MAIVEIVRFTLVYWSLWCTGHFGVPTNALAVALTIARDVIVAPLVPSTPRTVSTSSASSIMAQQVDLLDAGDYRSVISSQHNTEHESSHQVLSTSSAVQGRCLLVPWQSPRHISIRWSIDGLAVAEFLHNQNSTCSMNSLMQINSLVTSSPQAMNVVEDMPGKSQH